MMKGPGGGGLEKSTDDLAPTSEEKHPAVSKKGSPPTMITDVIAILVATLDTFWGSSSMASVTAALDLRLGGI